MTRWKPNLGCLFVTSDVLRLDNEKDVNPGHVKPGSPPSSPGEDSTKSEGTSVIPSRVFVATPVLETDHSIFLTRGDSKLVATVTARATELTEATPERSSSTATRPHSPWQV